jgi:hypothetical protein
VLIELDFYARALKLKCYWTIFLRKSSLQILPSIFGLGDVKDTDSNIFRNRVSNPAEHHVVAFLPRIEVWRIDKRLCQRTINHFKLVLGSKGSLHRATPSMVILNFKRGLNKNCSWIISMMEIIIK